MYIYLLLYIIFKILKNYIPIFQGYRLKNDLKSKTQIEIEFAVATVTAWSTRKPRKIYLDISLMTIPTIPHYPHHPDCECALSKLH